MESKKEKTWVDFVMFIIDSKRIPSSVMELNRLLRNYSDKFDIINIQEKLKNVKITTDNEIWSSLNAKHFVDSHKKSVEIQRKQVASKTERITKLNWIQFVKILLSKNIEPTSQFELDSYLIEYCKYEDIISIKEKLKNVKITTENIIWSPTEAKYFIATNKKSLLNNKKNQITKNRKNISKNELENTKGYGPEYLELARYICHNKIKINNKSDLDNVLNKINMNENKKVKTISKLLKSKIFSEENGWSNKKARIILCSIEKQKAEAENRSFNSDYMVPDYINNIIKNLSSSDNMKVCTTEKLPNSQLKEDVTPTDQSKNDLNMSVKNQIKRIRTMEELKELTEYCSSFQIKYFSLFSNISKYLDIGLSFDLEKKNFDGKYRIEIEMISIDFIINMLGPILKNKDILKIVTNANVFFYDLIKNSTIKITNIIDIQLIKEYKSMIKSIDFKDCHSNEYLQVLDLIYIYQNETKNLTEYEINQIKDATDNRIIISLCNKGNRVFSSVKYKIQSLELTIKKKIWNTNETNMYKLNYQDEIFNKIFKILLPSAINWEMFLLYQNDYGILTSIYFEMGRKPYGIYIKHNQKKKIIFENKYVQMDKICLASNELSNYLSINKEFSRVSIIKNETNKSVTGLIIHNLERPYNQVNYLLDILTNDSDRHSILLTGQRTLKKKQLFQDIEYFLSQQKFVITSGTHTNEIIYNYINQILKSLEESNKKDNPHSDQKIRVIYLANILLITGISTFNQLEIIKNTMKSISHIPLIVDFEISSENYLNYYKLSRLEKKVTFNLFNKKSSNIINENNLFSIAIEINNNNNNNNNEIQNGGDMYHIFKTQSYINSDKIKETILTHEVRQPIFDGYYPNYYPFLRYYI